MKDTVDYIVVGGASGCVVISKFLKNYANITLFEAGYSH
jgi:hypothetical protein